MLNENIQRAVIGYEELNFNEVFNPDLLILSIFLILIIAVALFFIAEILTSVKNLPGKLYSAIRYICIYIKLYGVKLLWQALVILFGFGFIGLFITGIFGDKTVSSFLTDDGVLFIAMFAVNALIAILIFRMTFQRMKPVLFKTWSKWPETQYDLFLTVPHKIDLKASDKIKKRSSDYWDPDKPTPASQQALYYAKARNSLQEVVLNLALFDFLFRKKSELHQEDDKKGLYSSVRMENWFIYFLSPVWISYVMLLFMMFFTQLFFSNEINVCSDFPMLFNYPNNFAWAVVIWFLISYFFVQSRVKQLEILYSKIHQGYFHTHLELVPQQILDDIAQIPSRSQLHEAIVSMQKLLNTMLITALPVFLLLLEVFSNSLQE